MENSQSSLAALQTEVEFYRQNQIIVEQEIRTLIADNQQLSRQVANLMKERINMVQHNNHDHDQGNMEELTKQVTLITKERDSLHVLWQTSQKTIDALETELKTYQSFGGKPKTEEKRDLELKLETALTDYIELETKFKELETKTASLENVLKEREKEIASYKERGKELDNRVKDESHVIEEYKINLEAERKRSEELKSQLAVNHKESIDAIKREAEAKSKVAEALQLYDLVAKQKDEALKKIDEITRELTQVKHILANVKRETEDEYRKEMDDVKDKFNEKVADMLGHIRNLDSELVEKGLLLNKTLRENKILKSTNDSLIKQQENNIKSVDPKLAIMEQRLEAMFQELVTSERRNIQLVCEKQCLAIDIQRIQDIHCRETKRRDWEERLLKTQCDEFKLQVENLQKSLKETHEMVDRLQSMLASRKELSQKMVSTKEGELTELNKHLENQMELSRKWKESYVEMTEKLKKRLDLLQNENKELRDKLKSYEGSTNEDISNIS